MMMRKLLFLMFVLGIASVASAGTAWFEVDAADYQASGEYLKDVAITINLVADIEANILQLGAIGSDTTMGAAGPPLVLNSKLSLLPLTGTLVNSGNILIEFIMSAVPFGGTNPAAGETLYSFEYTPVALGLVTIDDVSPYGIPPIVTRIGEDDWTFASDVVALDLNIIPEPATIALLGLGALALLRRRK